MPVYGYKCSQCSEYVELMQKITAPPLTVCEKCGGTMEKQLFPAGIVYKAKGFYTTEHGHAAKDFKKDSSESAKQPEASTKTPESSSKTESPSDTAKK